MAALALVIGFIALGVFVSPAFFFGIVLIAVLCA